VTGSQLRRLRDHSMVVSRTYSFALGQVPVVPGEQRALGASAQVGEPQVTDSGGPALVGLSPGAFFFRAASDLHRASSRVGLWGRMSRRPTLESSGHGADLDRDARGVVRDTA
jgi:hypothetical protein